MDIRNDRQKGLNYTEIGKKYHLDPRTAKRYAQSETKPAYQLSGPKPSILDPYKHPSNKAFSQWNEVFADVTIASAILDRVLHHCTVVNIKGESYRLKERKEFMKQKQHIVNALFEPS